MTSTKTSSDERLALKRACDLASSQAEGLRAIGSETAVERIEGWSREIRQAVAEGKAGEVADSAAHAIEQVRFLIQGLRAGLSNADLDARAELVNADLRHLGRVVRRMNESAEKPSMGQPPGS